MRELGRLLSYSRRYIPHLLASVVLMAAVGAAQGLTALLIGPIFDRVLNPQSADAPVPLFTLPWWKHTIYLDSFMPAGVHNVWVMVALAILVVYATKGLCDYFGNYLVNYVGLSAVTDLRQDVFDRVVHQDAHFFEANSTARVMSSIMNDLEKIQVATSQILADWLRQSFTAVFLLAVILQTDWKLALVSLTVLPFVLVPTVRLGKKIRRTTRGAQDDTAELNQVLQETLTRPPGGEIIRRGRSGIEPLPRPGGAAAPQQSALYPPAGHRVAADRFLRCVHHRVPGDLRAGSDQDRLDERR